MEPGGRMSKGDIERIKKMMEGINLKKGGIYIVEDLNFPEIHKMYNPTNEKTDLKSILKKINSGEKIETNFINSDEIEYLRNSIEDIKFYKGEKENSEIVFVKKKMTS